METVKLLALIESEGDLHSTQLAQYAPSKMPAVYEGLVRDGLIARNLGHGSPAFWDLTDQGRAVLLNAELQAALPGGHFA